MPKEKFFDPRKPFQSQRPETHEEWQARMGGEVLAVVRSGLYAPFKFVRKALFALDRTGKTNQKAPCCNQKLQQGAQTQFACRFLHPDYTVGPGVAPGQHPCGWSRTLPPVGNCTPP